MSNDPMELSSSTAAAAASANQPITSVAIANKKAKKLKATANSNAADRRATVPDLRHQQSFEKRYSHMIHKQILETSINRDVLQRQMNAFFPFSKSPPKSMEGDPKEIEKQETTIKLQQGEATDVHDDADDDDDDDKMDTSTNCNDDMKMKDEVETKLINEKHLIAATAKTFNDEQQLENV